MKTFNKAFYFLLPSILLLSVSAYATVTNDYRNFSLRGSVQYYKGDMKAIGNTVLVAPNPQGNVCATYTNGAYLPHPGDSTHANESYYLCGYQVDTGTTNSTTSELTLPTGATIKWAGLYWQALVSNTDFSTTMTIKMKKDSDSYIENITYDDLDYRSNSGATGYTSYSAFKNVTNIFTTNNWGEGNYTVANIPVTEGKINGLGTYGAWSLVVIYEDLTQGQKYRSFSVFDGWKVVKDADTFRDVQVDVSGFYTPNNTGLSAKVAVFTAEGDEAWTGDYLKTFDYNNASSSETLGVDADQTFKSLISGGGARTPNPTNNMGIDIQTFDIGSYLSPKQTDMEFHFTSDGDTYWPSFLVFSTELYVPVLCYDYAYSQQGMYFTESNSDGHLPRIEGEIQNGTDDNISVKVFIKNQIASDVKIINFTASIEDINTSQATYIDPSTRLAHRDHLIPVDASSTPSSPAGNPQSVTDIYIGELDANDYFYLYYDLDPASGVTYIDMPLNITADYNISVPDGAGTIVPGPTLSLQDVDIEMCANTDFAYMPASGIFNVVQNDYFNIDEAGGTNQFYNIPTQVVNRTANIKVVSMDPDNLDNLKSVTTIAAVEMIDAAAFHDTNASCQEQASSINDKVWVIFDTNTTTTSFNLASGLVPSNFYDTARQNAAYRISYNLADRNGSIIDLNITTGPSYTVKNFDVNTTAHTCFDGTSDVGTECPSSMDRNALISCMECMYGLRTKMVCSRDNFSIRPEAFNMHIDDQNQTHPTSQISITGTAGTIIDMAADYNYNLEVNASNHKAVTSSFGYTKSFSSNIANGDISQYTWEPRDDGDGQGIVNDLTYCNDRNDTNVTIRFINGAVDTNTSSPQIGKYRLNILDKTWTAVDSNITFMDHHLSDYFYPTGKSSASDIGLDCYENQSDTHAESSSITLGSTSSLNGCDISSSHDGSDATNIQYTDKNVTFHPYKFVVTNTVTLGLSDPSNPKGVLASSMTNPFIYISDINTTQDENMSVHFNTTITAYGKNSTSGLRNFVKGCYAKPLDINITKSPTTSSELVLSYRYHDYNSSGDAILLNNINAFIDHGNEDVNITLTTPSGVTGSFQKDMNGTIDTRVNLNFNKEINASTNPEKITFISYNIDDPNNTFNADLNPVKTAEGNVSMDQNITFYYGRTAARKTRKVCDTDSNTTCDANEVFIYYEVFCSGNTNGNNCSNALLPKDVSGNSLQKVDSRWFQSLDHNTTTYGQITDTNDSVNPSYITLPNGITHANEYTSDSVHRYQISNGLPYTADMNDTVPRWLVHDENNATATTNSHIVIYRAKTKWSGEHEADSTTKTDNVQRVNRRTMW